MKKLLTTLVLLAAAGGGGYYYYSSTQTVEKPQVTQATISQGNVTEAVTATGTLSAIRLVDVGSQVSGIVKDVYVDYNSIVKKDQLIATIDPVLLQVQVDLQLANVERQKGEIAIQEVQLEDAVKQTERTKQMFDKGLANQQQLDAAVLTVKQRQTSLDSAKKSLLTSEANLNQAKLNVSYTNIYAPIDGVVVQRQVDPGKAVQASMTTPQFFQIATDLRTLKLSAGVDEADIGKIRPDMRVTFQVESYPNTTFEGVVDAVRLNASTQNNVVTYPVWISVPNPDLRLRPSMTANVRIIISTAANVVRVPNQALRFRPTNDMYTALGLTPPPPGQGRGLAGGPGRGEAAAAGVAANAPAATAPQAAPAAGQRRQGEADAARPQGGDQVARQGGNGGGRQPMDPSAFQGRNGGQGGGRGQAPGGGRFGNMSPEERQRMMAQFGGRNGGGRGGRGGANTNVAPVELTADKIDDMFAPMQVRPTNGQVWKWDEANKKLSEVRISTGLNDGQFSQLLTGELKVGDQIVTNIVVPLTAAQRAAQQQSIFGGQQGRGNFGGPQPGNFGGPQGGGGGGARGGGGGGGRGGF